MSRQKRGIYFIYGGAATNLRSFINNGLPGGAQAGKRASSRFVARYPPRLRDGGLIPAFRCRIRDPARLQVGDSGPVRQGLLVGARLRRACSRDRRLEVPRVVYGAIGTPRCPARLPRFARPPAGGSQTLILLALVKAAEYACLGVVIGWMGHRAWGGVLAHAAVGLAVGILFGGAILSFTYWTAPEPLGATGLFSRAINEIIFPVGCSLVLYAATALGKRG